MHSTQQAQSIYYINCVYTVLFIFSFELNVRVLLKRINKQTEEEEKKTQTEWRQER